MQEYDDRLALPLIAGGVMYTLGVPFFVRGAYAQAPPPPAVNDIVCWSVVDGFVVLLHPVAPTVVAVPRTTSSVVGPSIVCSKACLLLRACLSGTVNVLFCEGTRVLHRSTNNQQTNQPTNQPTIDNVTPSFAGRRCCCEVPDHTIWHMFVLVASFLQFLAVCVPSCRHY